MKHCRRCNCGELEVVRETVTRRGRHQYAMCWYRCPDCHEVSLSYRPLHAFVEEPSSVPARSELSPPEGDPVLSH